MKNFTPKNKNTFYILSLMFLGLLLTSCTSTQAVYSENDGIYESSPARVVAVTEEVPAANYQRYFETEANNIYIEEDEIFTDIDGYVGYSDADEGAVQIEGDYNYGNTPWGYNDSNVSISFNMGFGYGGYWGFPYYGYYNPWYWGYPGYGWGYPGYGWGWGYPGYGWGWGYPGYGWGYPGHPIYYPPYGGGTYGKRNNYPVRYADNGSRTGYTRTSQAGSTRPNIYKNSVAQNSSSRSTNYRRNASNAVNNSYQRYNQQSSNRNTNSYNRNANSRPSYSPSMGGNSGYSRGSSAGMRSSSGGRRNGPNVVSTEQGVNQIQSNSKDYRSTGRPVQSDFRSAMNALLLDRDNEKAPVRYEWTNGQARRVNLDQTQRQEILKKMRDYSNASNTTSDRNYLSGKNSARSTKSYKSSNNNRRVSSSNAKSSSPKSSGSSSTASNSRSSSSSGNASMSSSTRSSSSGSYARSSGGGSRKQ